MLTETPTDSMRLLALGDMPQRLADKGTQGNSRWLANTQSPFLKLADPNFSPNGVKHYNFDNQKVSVGNGAKKPTAERCVLKTSKHQRKDCAQTNNLILTLERMRPYFRACDGCYARKGQHLPKVKLHIVVWELYEAVCRQA